MNIRDLEHLRSDKKINFKQEEVDGVKVIIVAYQISDNEMWTKQHAIETRGITFLESTGECISRPFEKFFNLGENEWTQQSNLVFDDSTLIQEKRDGSMITPVLINSEVFWKTKKSFYSSVALEAEKYINSIPKNQNPDYTTFSQECLYPGYTPIFEFTSLNSKIVIDYGQTPSLTLLAIRNIVTGEYIENFDSFYVNENKSINPIVFYGIPCIKTYNPECSIQDFIKQIPSQKHIEGYVIHCKDKSDKKVKVKVKTQWYIDNHHVMTDLRERDVVEAALNETLDDIKSTVSLSSVSIDEINAIEHRYAQIMESIIEQTEALAAKLKVLSRKEAALLYSNNKYFSLAMKLNDGKEPDYKKFFRAYHLKVDFSLKVVYNPTFSKDIH